jgi:hypothetical protein
MALPKIELPLFELEVPSTGKKVKYRPFTVKEEKILLIAQEAKDIDQIVLAMKQIINNCVQGVDPEKLATFDMEYLVINIRSKSVNNVVDFKIRDPETNEEVPLSLNLDDVKVRFTPDHNNVIRINDDSVIVMRYPTINEISALLKSKTKEAMFDIMVACIDKIESAGSVYLTDEYSKEEMIEFVDGLTNSTLSGIQKFFDTLPVLRFERKYINKNGVEKTFVVEGMETFFL